MAGVRPVWRGRGGGMAAARRDCGHLPPGARLAFWPEWCHGRGTGDPAQAIDEAFRDQLAPDDHETRRRLLHMHACSPRPLSHPRSTVFNRHLAPAFPPGAKPTCRLDSVTDTQERGQGSPLCH